KGLHIVKGEHDYTLKKAGDAWRLTGKFDAAVPDKQIEPLTIALANLRAVRYIAHEADDLDKLGLKKPFASVTFTVPAKKGDKDPGYTLGLGNPDEKDAKVRYARLAGSKAVFVVADKVTDLLPGNPLDFLDKALLRLDPKTVREVRFTGAAPFTLKRDRDEWQGGGTPQPFTPHEKAGAGNRQGPPPAPRPAGHRHRP